MIDKTTLLDQLGSPYTNHVVERFLRFIHLPNQVLEKLDDSALNEHWGRDHYVLQKYLAV